MRRSSAHTAPVTVVAPVHPLVSGAAQFNTAMISALREHGPVQALSWRRLYPPLIHRRDTHDLASRPTRHVDAEALLDWSDPRTWRAALRRCADAGSQALVLPWIHPVMAPPYAYLLRRAPERLTRVVICHNVEPHEHVPFARPVSRGVLGQADLLVVHSSHQTEELARLGLGSKPVLKAFHPRFVAEDLCQPPSPAAVAQERARQGYPDLSLLAFGAIRPYKGIDLALEALARVRSDLRIRLTVAGVFWDGGEALREHVSVLGLQDRVELRDGFVSNEEAALLFAAAHASVLPYRTASQSGVVQLSFAYGRPVIATAVGGLGEAVADGEDGVLCRPADVEGLATAIERMADGREEFTRRVRRAADEHSFSRYAALLHGELAALGSRGRAGRTLPLHPSAPARAVAG